MDNLNILQWNSRSIKCNKAFLETLLHKSQIHIALISETWFLPSETFYISGYKIIRQDRADGYGGSCILIKNCIPFTNLHNTNNLSDFTIQICSITIHLKNKNLTISSVYSSPKHKINTKHWENIFNSLPSPHIIGGDVNSHHFAWGSATVDNEGTNLLDAINNKPLTILNDGSPTLLSRPGQNKSAVDITLSSPNIAMDLEWTTVNNTYGSNHLPIIISYKKSIDNNYTLYPNSKWDIKKADWLKYYTSSTLITENISSQEFNSLPIADKYNQILHLINTSAENSIPPNKVKKVNSFRRSPWWDTECNFQLSNTKQIFQAYKNNSTVENYIECRRSIALSRRLYKNKKSTCWRTFCSSMNSSTSVSEVWTKIKILKNRAAQKNSTPLVRDDWINDFLYNLTPSSCNEHSINSTSTYVSTPMIEAFTYNELEYCIKQTTNSAPGHDSIHYPMIANLCAKAKDLLLRMYNDVWLNSHTIPEWSVQHVIPILKPSKDPNDSSSYRPIALSSCLAKTFERLIKLRLEWWLENNNFLPPHQHGFRKGHSTIDNLATLVTDIQLSFSQNTYLSSLFLDLKGAFDQVSVKILEAKMITLGIPFQIISAIINLIKQRTVFIKYKGSLTGPRETQLGLPQGSVLSPLLFNLYTYDLCKIFKPNIKVLQFADDIIIYCSEKTFMDTRFELNIALKEFNEWILHHGFEISKEKSTVSVYTRHRLNKIPSFIKLADHNFNITNTVKFLGLYIDNKLSWKPQVNSIIKKCEKRLNVLRTVTNLHWGADPKTALMLYKNLILSVIDYGSSIYGSAAASTLQPLNVIQSRAVRLSIGALHSTPINILLAECHIQPLHLRRQLLAARFMSSRMMSHLHFPVASLATEILTGKYWNHKKIPPLVEGFIDLVNIIPPAIDSLTLPCFSFPHTFSLPNKFFVTDLKFAPDTTNESFLTTIERKWPNFYHFYTDASINNTGTGCAFLAPFNNIFKQYKLPELSSIYTAEMIAIKLCLEHINNNLNQLPENIIIFSDSKSVLEKLQYPGFCNKNSSIIYDIIYTLTTLKSSNINVKIIWVKGHSNIIHNQEVDSLAKEARRMGVNIQLTVPYNDVCKLIKKNMNNAWNNEYKTSITTKGILYGQLQPLLPIKPWFTSNYSRKFITTICRLRFNHTLCKQHLFKINMSPSPSCICDNSTVEDINHLIFSCPRFDLQRLNLFEELIQHKIYPPLNIQCLLTPSNLDVLNILFNFINTCTLKI